MLRKLFLTFALIAGVVSSACGSVQKPYQHLLSIVPPWHLAGLGFGSNQHLPNGIAAPFTHVIIIFQENRTPDQLLSDANCTSQDAQFFGGVGPSPYPTPLLLPRCLTNFSFAQAGMVGKKMVYSVPNDLCAINSGCACHDQSLSAPWTGYNTCQDHGIANYDPKHQHIAFQKQWNNGKMNGWNNITFQGNCPSTPDPNGKSITYCANTYTPVLEVEPYVNIMTQYATNDNFFQDNQGPSFPAHQYIISGASTCGTVCLPTKTIAGACCLNHATPPPTTAQYAMYSAANNPDNGNGGGCDAPGTGQVDMIDQYGTIYPDLLFPCFDRLTLPDLLTQAGLTWKYYQNDGAGAGLWHGPDAIWHLWNSTSYTTNVDSTKYDFFNDVCTNHTLANVVWITPDNPQSDHANQSDGSGPDYVASLINAVGGGTVSPPEAPSPGPTSWSCDGRFWNSTLILVMWDDWGGWFDHVAPVIFNPYEKGFRTPYANVSAYTINGMVDHTFASWGSGLKLIEEIFNLPSLGTTDYYASSDLTNEFNFTQTPAPFQTIAAQLKYEPPKYFARVPQSHDAPDY